MKAGKGNGWTPERRARQAEAIRAWRPWEKSTGPTTPAGKAAASRNAWRGGHRAQMRELVRLVNEEVRAARELMACL